MYLSLSVHSYTQESADSVFDPSSTISTAIGTSAVTTGTNVPSSSPTVATDTSENYSPSPSTSNSTPSSNPEDPHSASSRLVIGIVSGIIAGVILITAAIYFLMRRRRRRGLRGRRENDLASFGLATDTESAIACFPEVASRPVSASVLTSGGPAISTTRKSHISNAG